MVDLAYLNFCKIVLKFCVRKGITLSNVDRVVRVAEFQSKCERIKCIIIIGPIEQKKIP